MSGFSIESTLNAERVRQRRMELKLSQAEVAERIKMPQTSYSRLERGESYRNDLLVRKRLAKALDTTEEYLCEPTEPPIAAPRKRRGSRFVMLNPTKRPRSMGGGEADDPTERDGSPVIERPEEPSPLERVLGQAFDANKHTISDGHAVLRVLRQTFQRLDLGAEMVTAARTWLDGAAALRREGQVTTAEQLLIYVTLGKTQRAVAAAGQQDVDGSSAE